MARIGFRGNFLLTTLLPSVLVTLTVIAGVLIFFDWSTQTIDGVSAARQRELVNLGVRNARKSIAESQEIATYWNGTTPDFWALSPTVWNDARLGAKLYAGLGIDEAYVLDGTNKPVYAFSNGSDQAPKAFYDRYRQTRVSLGRLRQRLAVGEVLPADSYLRSIGEVDFALIDRRPVVISLKPVYAEHGNVGPAPGHEYIHVAIRFLDVRFIAALEKDYLLDDLRFELGRSQEPLAANLPLVDLSGMTLGYYTWRPFQPGRAFLSSVQTGAFSAALAVLAVVLILVFALYRRRVAEEGHEDRIRYLAHHDALTGLPNRALFVDEIDAQLADVVSGKAGEALAVLYLDLDRFKQVNDTLGHAAGDAVINVVVGRLRQVLGDRGRIYRVGGDEFNIVIGNCRGEEIDPLCRALIAAVEQPITLGGGNIFIGLSIGLSMAPLHGTDRTELVRKADVALYNAKTAGRGQYSVFGAQMDALIRDRAAIERAMRRDLDSGDHFWVAYQPKFAADGRTIVGAEALARWSEPERGQVSPAVFVPIAEEMGLMARLGLHVLQTACGEAAHWQIDHLAVNVSVVQLRESTFLAKVMDVLATTGMPAGRLEFEITESIWIDGNAQCLANLEALRAAGIRIALDDFGTGFSTFERLRDTSVDRIKIDQSFISGFGKARGDEAIVGAIIELARARGLKTTAEGIETTEQLQALQAMGCDDLQGFLLGRPMSAGAFKHLLGEAARSRRAIDRRSSAAG